MREHVGAPKDAGCRRRADAGVGHRKLVEVQLRGPADGDPFAHQVPVFVVRRDLRAFAPSHVKPAGLQLDSANRFRGQIQLLEVRVRRPPAGPDPGRIPTADERRARERTDMDRETLPVVQGQPRAQGIFRLHLTRGYDVGVVLDEPVPRIERQCFDFEPRRRRRVLRKQRRRTQGETHEEQRLTMHGDLGPLRRVRSIDCTCRSAVVSSSGVRRPVSALMCYRPASAAGIVLLHRGHATWSPRSESSSPVATAPMSPKTCTDRIDAWQAGHWTAAARRYVAGVESVDADKADDCDSPCQKSNSFSTLGEISYASWLNVTADFATAFSPPGIDIRKLTASESGPDRGGLDGTRRDTDARDDRRSCMTPGIDVRISIDRKST